MSCRTICTAVIMSCVCVTLSAGDFRSEDVLFYGRDSLLAYIRRLCPGPDDIIIF